jgi:hypothetical protein
MAVAVGVGVGDGVGVAVGVDVGVVVGGDVAVGVAEGRRRVRKAGAPLTRSEGGTSAAVRQPAIKIMAISTAATLRDSRFMTSVSIGVNHPSSPEILSAHLDFGRNDFLEVRETPISATYQGQNDKVMPCTAVGGLNTPGSRSTGRSKALAKSLFVGHSYRRMLLHDFPFTGFFVKYHCYAKRDGIAVLELNRVLVSHPADVAFRKCLWV